MNIDNYIEYQYQELLSCCQINIKYIKLYQFVKNQKLRDILTTLHHEFISLFKTMNKRLPTDEDSNHFWADSSRSLIEILNITLGLFETLKSSSLAFDIDDYYKTLFYKCRSFLKNSGGSELPPHMDKITLYYTEPIFKSTLKISIPSVTPNLTCELKLIGNGSYANVYKYKDPFYNQFFILKRAKKELTTKEIERFKQEFEVMSKLSSPYILSVYFYDSTKNEYIMEYADYTLDAYITKFNTTLSLSQRKCIVLQILNAFAYIHSKNILHRDISPKNILIKEYDDRIVIKISDFGLIKLPDSSLTTVNTEFKGYFNDPSLITDGFSSYNMSHEIYALTRIIYFVITGKSNINNIDNNQLGHFVSKGLNTDKSKRFKNVQEMINEFKMMYKI